GTEYPNDAPGSGGGQTEPPQTGDTDGDQSNNTQPDDNVEPEPPQDGGTAGNGYPNDTPASGGGQTEPPQTGDTDGDQSNNTQPDDNVEPEPPQDGGTAGNGYPNDTPTSGGGQTEPPQTGGSGQSNPTHNDGVNGGNTTYPTGGPSSQTSGNASNVNDNRVATSDDSNYGDLSQSSNKVKQNSNSINNSTDVNSNSGRDSNPSNYQNDSLSYNYEQNKNATSSGAKPASAQTFGDLANQQKDSNEDSDSNVMNRFRQLSPGSFKYNPYVLKQVKALNNDDSNVSDSDINAIFSKQKFTDNSYLRELQKSTNYFKFQYFNPIKFDDYYKNLDNQVLSLITGEIGSMPDLKAPKTKKTQGAYEYEESDDTETTQTRQEAEKADKGLKFERVLFTLIAGIIVIFIGVVTTYFIHRRKK
ncbi:SdrH family protein, partial [Staphylococcus arlettae]